MGSCLGGGSGGGTNTNTVVQQSSPPSQFLNAYSNLTNVATNQASAPLNQYGGSMVAGFTPQQTQAFNTTSNLQGQYAPYLNAAAGSFGQATQPLWPSLPQFDTSGLPQGATTAINNAQQYGAAAAQPIAQQLFPYTETAMGAAQNLTTNAAPYAAIATQPIDTRSYTNPATAAAASAPGAISQFESPYTQQVTSALQGLFNQQNAQQLQQVRGSSVGQGAYGGDREAVAEALTAQQQQLSEAPAMSQALQAGYQSSLQAAQQQAALEAQTGLGAGQLGLQGQLGQGQLGLGAGNLITQAGAQQGQLALGAGGLLSQGLTSQGQLGLGAGQLNLAAGQGLFNEFNTQQQQQLAAEQANAWLNSQAGFGLSSLGQESQNLGLGGAQALLGTGGLQQQLSQEQLNIPYEQFQQQQAYPYQQLGFLAPIVEGAGSAAGGSSSTSYPGASLGSQLGGLGITGIGAAGLANQAGLFNGGLFGGGAGDFQTFGGGAADFSSASAADLAAAGIGSTAADLSAATGAGGALLGGIPLVKRGGRIGYEGGGLASGAPGSGFVLPPDATLTSQPNGLAHLPQPPKIGLDSIVPPGPAVKTGSGPPKPPQGGPTAPGSQDLTPQQEMQGLGQAIKLFDKPDRPESSARGGLIGIPHPHLGGGLADMSHLAKPAMESHAGLGHPAFAEGGVVIPIAPYLQARQDQRQQSINDRVDALNERLKGLADQPPPIKPQGYDTGGMVSPLTAAAPLSGTSPNTQTFYQQLTQMPLEQLREMSVRVPPATSQGQMVQRALAAKEMTPGAGTAASSPAPSGGLSAMPGQQGMGLATGSGMGGIGGYADGGSIPEDPDADPHPIVDHSGKTVVIHYPSEGKSLDLGIPSSPTKDGMAQGGRLRLAAGGPSPDTSPGIAPPSQAYQDQINAQIFAKVPPPSAPSQAYRDQINAQIFGTPPPPSSTTAPSPGQTAQQNILNNALAPPPSQNPGFNIPRPQASNPFANIQVPSAVNVGSATIPHPMTYNPIQPPQIGKNDVVDASLFPTSLLQPSGGYNNTAPALPSLPIPSPTTTWFPSAWGGAGGGRARGLADGGLADAANEISSETKEVLAESDADSQPAEARATLPPPAEARATMTPHGLAGTSTTIVAPSGGGLASRPPPLPPPDLETTRAAPGTGGTPATPSTIVATETGLGMGAPASPSTTAAKPSSRYTEIPDYLHPLFEDIESGESKGKDVLYGGKPVPPGNVIPGAIGPTGQQTHAFSEFQFQPDTWNRANEAAQAQGRTLDKDNRPDREWAALYTARADYKARTGRDLDEDAKAGNINRSALTGTWTSLGSGSGGAGGGTGIATHGGAGDPVIRTGVIPPGQNGLAGTPDGSESGLARVIGSRTQYEPGPGASPWLALIAAGLGTMAGRSPQGLVNLGQGGLQGVKVLEQQEQEKMRQAQIANEAENRQATLGLEQQRITQTGKYQQNEIGVRTQDTQIRQQQADQAFAAANQRFEVEMSRAKTAEERAHIMDQHYIDIAQHQQISDSITAAWRAAAMAKPIGGRNEAGQLGNFVFSPEQGKYTFTPGDTVAKQPAPTTFDRKREAYLAVHEGDQEGANNFAAGHKTMSSEEISLAAERMANQQMVGDPAMVVAKPEEKQARQAQLKRFIESDIRSTSGAQTSAAGATTAAPAAPAAATAAPKPPDQATATAGAKAAIASKPDVRDAVIAQMRAWGYDPSGL